VLQSLRRYLLQQLKDLIPASGETLAESAVVQASALIRLYSALKGIATLKYVCPLSQSVAGGWNYSAAVSLNRISVLIVWDDAE